MTLPPAFHVVLLAEARAEIGPDHEAHPLGLLVAGLPTLDQLQGHAGGLVTGLGFAHYGMFYLPDEARSDDPLNPGAIAYWAHASGTHVPLFGNAVLVGPADEDGDNTTATPFMLEALAAVGVVIDPDGAAEADALEVLDPSLRGGLTPDAWALDRDADEHWLAVCPSCGYTELLEDPEAARSAPCPGGGEDDRGREYPCRVVGRLLVIGQNTATTVDEYPRWRTLRGA
jgi:hypothetical protein